MLKGDRYMRQLNNHSTMIKVIVIILFIISLTGFRLIWINHFQHETDQPLAESGTLDLRSWDFLNKGIVTLSGEWSFYPEMLGEDLINQRHEQTPISIQSPGDWSQYINEDVHSPYGYGTYYLRIQVDPTKKERFKIQVPSVRSASTLYVNGEIYGSSGKVGVNELDAKGRNIPYISSTITPNEEGEIHLYIQASNYEDPRASGLVRSVKLGLEEHITSETNFSMMLQTMAAVIFFVHALFAIIAYFIGIRDRRLLHFSIMLTALALINLTFGDEKVLYQYVEVSYAFSLKGALLLGLLCFFSLVQLIRHQTDNITTYLLYGTSIIYIILAILIIVLPVQYINYLTQYTGYVVVFTLVLTFIVFLKSKVSKDFMNSLSIILAMIAILSHFVWFFYLMSTGIKVVHYPFDLIIAIFCIGTVWFKQYYNLHKESIALANRLTIVDETKDEFLANTSHELRNPIHSVLNISNALLQREKDSLHEESITDLATIIAVSERMSFTVNELLDIAVVEGGSPKLKLYPVSMKAITSGVIDMVAYSIEDKSIEIKNNISDELPYVQGDENRLIQIMFNLIHNAIKYTPKGTIEINGEIKEAMIYISVSDSGVGMSEKTVQNIFNRYVQGANADTIAEGGFGIGLYISKQLIELHGGTISVESTQGKGSTFTVALPMAETEETISHEENKAEIIEERTAISVVQRMNDKNAIETDEEKVIQDRPRIIIVDDEKVNLRVIETVLTDDDYDMTSVLSAEEVLELLREREWDLVIADVMMPGMSGYELTSTIRNRFSLSELPVLLVTARGNQDDIRFGFASGANDYITKPVDAVELRSRVKALTDARQSMHERLRIEAAWLQAQIKPHFLFNTLNSIIALSQFDPGKTTEMLNAFSDILRAKFNFENLDALVPIDRELSLIKSYIYIEQVRFGDRLRVYFSIDEGINMMIPTLSIQPLVENAINHGVMGRDTGGKVNIRITSVDEAIKVVVEDDGIGMDEVLLRNILTGSLQEKSSVGLINIHLRLKRHYGKGLTIESEMNKGTTVTFMIPK